MTLPTLEKRGHGVEPNFRLSLNHLEAKSPDLEFGHGCGHGSAAFAPARWVHLPRSRCHIPLSSYLGAGAALMPPRGAR
jgi:hypothetical protein